MIDTNYYNTLPKKRMGATGFIDESSQHTIRSSYCPEEKMTMKIYSRSQYQVGEVNRYGTVTNNDGRKIGDVSEDGTVIDGYGRHVGNVSEDGIITNDDDSKIGEVSEDGTVTDRNDSKIGEVDMADDGNLHFAGGAALLLLLTAKQ